MANKVLFGFKNLYVGTYVENEDGTVTMGTPYHQKGAVGFSPEDQGDSNTFSADDTAYYTSYSSGSKEGDIVVAMFDDEFKKKFLGFEAVNGGGTAQLKNAKKPSVYIAFEIQGDQEGRRELYYNGTLGAPTREYATIEEDGTEVQTETSSAKFVGENVTEKGYSMVTFNPGDTYYDTLFTNPPTPQMLVPSDDSDDDDNSGN